MRSGEKSGREPVHQLATRVRAVGGCRLRSLQRLKLFSRSSGCCKASHAVTTQAGGDIEERVQSFELALRNGQQTRDGLPEGERNGLTWCAPSYHSALLINIWCGVLVMSRGTCCSFYV